MVDRTRTLRGALAGGTAASVWTLQQPLDRRLFRSGYDDVELLGKAVTRGRAWPAVGLALHLSNGALFGAVYADVAPLVAGGVPPVVRGAAAGMVEHLALWPLVRLTDRLHPAREELPRLGGNRRAFWQATWRHLVFGLVLGELERRLNPPSASIEEEPTAEYEASTNGHGSLENAVLAGPASP